MGENAFGQPIRRKEDSRLLTGKGKYAEDVSAAGQAHAFMLRAQHAHAKILRIDAAAARAAPGVLAVLTGAELTADGLGPLPANGTLIKLPGVTLAAQEMVRKPRPLLALDSVRFSGEAVAMVLAETLEQARDAAELIEIDYETLPAITDTAGAFGADAPQVWPDAPKNVCFDWQAGNIEAATAAFARAHKIVKLEAANNRVVVGAMENRNAIGSYDAETGRYTLTTGTQMPHGVRDQLAEFVFGVPLTQIRVLVPDVGGSFGIKNAVYPEQALVLWAAKRLGRTVRWIGDRSDSFLSDCHARDNVSLGELALDAEGNILALRVTTTSNIGAYLSAKGMLSPTTNTPAYAGVYRTPAIHIRVIGVYTHTAPTEVYRGAGRPEAIHLLERLIEEAARESGLGSLAFRRRNILTPAELPFPTPLGLVYDSGDFAKTLDGALAKADAEGFAARKAKSQAAGKLRGLGLAHYCERVGGGWTEKAWLDLDSQAKATVRIGTMSNGQGHETIYAQMVAERLGIPIDDVTLIQGDTDLIESGHGTGGSASLPIGGVALDRASSDIIKQVTALAADELEVAEADVIFEDGSFKVAGTDVKAPLAKVAARLGDRVLTGDGLFAPQTPTFPNGCHVAEVEIDPETGVVAIEGYHMVHDFGRVLNPLLLEGQLHGGVVQGLGQAMLEHVVYDRDSGQLLSGSLMDYCLPRADDVPFMSLETVETPSPFNPLGVKGCGEAGAAGAPPALMNAIMDALAPLGVAHLDMPATPLRVWEAIQASHK